MTNSDTYRDKEREKDPLSLFDGGSVLWDKSKEDIWAEMDALLEHGEEGKVVSFTRRSRMIAAAAFIILLLGVPGIMRFYTKTIQSDAGEHLAILLPDNSEVDLNALTTIKYNPLWWRFNREVKLEGEAFFNVDPGSDFEVISQAATTMVVGTSFNIVAR
ncbi:MAG: FecR family protein [Bacteroidales bacterium]|nr:FecR family protein [Bacteroidales bacterium]